MSKPEEHKVDMPCYVVVDGTPYMRADIGHELLEACKTVYAAFNRGNFDKFGRLKLTKAGGEALWFVVSQAVRKADGDTCA